MGTLKISRLLLYGIGLIAMIGWSIFPENTIMSAATMHGIFLVCLTASLILSMIEFEVKQGKNAGKLGRYLMYVTSVITMAGLVLAANKVPYSKLVMSIGLIGVVVSMPLLFIDAEKTAKPGNSMGKPNRYLLYISMMILITGLALRMNRVAYGTLATSIGLIGVGISMALFFIKGEKGGTHNIKLGKLNRYLLYITMIVMITGLLFKINKIAFSNMLIYIGLIIVIISVALSFINGKKTKRVNSEGDTA